jgi:predicted dehydrogenase
MHTRRSFLAAISTLPAAFAFANDPARPMKACIIGHTGLGDYGHGLDAVFADRPDIELVAVADPNAAGLAKAKERTGAKRAYADYREMLDKERPSLVSVAPRTTGERREMLLAALNTPAHVISEKPFVRSPADGDQVLALATKQGLRIAVAHQIRMAPAVTHLKKRIDDGLIGDLLEIRAFGKQDRRAGGEDLIVLGVHLFDLMRLFAGDPSACFAHVWEKGRPAKLADAKKPGEDIGPILGDEIHALFTFNNSVTATFTSRARLAANTAHWGLELIGSKASARILADIWPRVMFRPYTKWADTGRTDDWKPLDDDPALKATPDEKSTAACNKRLTDDWLASISEKRDPTCSGHNAAKAVEMAISIWQSALVSAPVTLPLQHRAHPLL